MDEVHAKLSDDLQEIYDSELARGNAVLRVDEPAGTTCPLAIVFEKAMRKPAPPFPKDSNVYWHESEVRGMAGAASRLSGHFVYGPKQGR